MENIAKTQRTQDINSKPQVIFLTHAENSVLLTTPNAMKQATLLLIKPHPDLIQTI